jgi:hypothetical protein
MGRKVLNDLKRYTWGTKRKIHQLNIYANSSKVTLTRSLIPQLLGSSSVQKEYLPDRLLVGKRTMQYTSEKI